MVTAVFSPETIHAISAHAH